MCLKRCYDQTSQKVQRLSTDLQAYLHKRTWPAHQNVYIKNVLYEDGEKI